MTWPRPLRSGLAAVFTIVVTTWAGLAAAEDSAQDAVSDADRQFWSFRRIVRPAAPPVRNQSLVRTPIDAFVLSRLEAAGLEYSPDTDRRTFIRRLSLDLTGLPPTPAEVSAFHDDDDPDAAERLVDRLLESPQFGERWGRHWLDVAGYVDTVGFDVDPGLIITSEGKWQYRDYVIRAFNADRPYDRFLTEQLAGDELVDWRQAETFTPEIRELLVATGFLRTAADFTHEDVGNIAQNHFGVLHDTLEIVGTSLLGLTLNCARCHTHKFDPIPHTDYYRLMALLTPAYNPGQWKIVFPYDPKLEDRTLADVSPAERAQIEQHNAALDRQAAEAAARLDAIQSPHRERLFAARLALVSEPIRADVKEALALPPEKRDEIQKYLAAKFEGSLKVPDVELSAALSEAERTEAEAISRQLAELKAQRRGWGKLQALYDIGPAPVTLRLLRGNHETPGEEVAPGFLQVLCDADESPLAAAEPPFAGTSGRRLALARWLTRGDSRAGGLAARVMVNRLWQHLFGAGLVPTPENFGVSGAPPTHPELLEWLSGEFIARGWRIKPLLRRIVLSSVYRQASARFPIGGRPDVGTRDPRAVDPENRLLWRMPLKRLEGEVIRDAVLAACGALDSGQGGPPVPLESRPDGMIVIADKQLRAPADRFRRSVYLLARRAFPLSELTVFDQPIVATSCPERPRSAVPLQSLTMLNGALLWEQSARFAERLIREAPASDEAAVALAFQVALGRDPEPDEALACLRLVERHAALHRGETVAADEVRRKALTHVCHTLLNTSEFLYSP